MASLQRNATRLAGVLFALGALACTADDPVVNEVGTVTMFPTNPAIVTQNVTIVPSGSTLSENRMQAVYVHVKQALLTVDNRPGEEFNLLFPESGDTSDCLLGDTPLSTPVSIGPCIDFLVLESASDTAGTMGTLVLDLDLELKRVEPVVLFAGNDEDGDGVFNAVDNCPLAPNGDCDADPLNCDVNRNNDVTPEELDVGNQRDTGNLGFGNACRFQDAFSGILPDADGDGVIDLFDNCAHVPNADQANPPTGLFPALESLTPDGIGYACEPGQTPMNPWEQQVIRESAAPTINFDFVLPQAQGFIVIDFNDALVFTNCDWVAGTCMDGWEDLIEVCIRTNAADAVQGCS